LSFSQQHGCATVHHLLANDFIKRRQWFKKANLNSYSGRAVPEFDWIPCYPPSQNNGGTYSSDIENLTLELAGDKPGAAAMQGKQAMFVLKFSHASLKHSKKKNL